MSIVDRIFLALMSLVLLLVSSTVLMYSAGIISLKFLGTSLNLYYGRWEVGIVAALILLISVRFLVMAVKTDKVQEIIVSSGELGKVGVSFNAIESLVQKVIQENPQVKETKVYLKGRDGGLGIRIRLSIEQDIVIPAMAEELQSNIKEYIQITSGTIVKEVSVNVDRVSFKSGSNTLKQG